jgi:uncharacterized protein YodC (DUF2158 family)
MSNGCYAMQPEAPQSMERQAMNYKTGDGVMLKSGGRPMTATWVGPVAFAPGTWLICEWFSDAGESRVDMFRDSTLERAREETSTLTASVQ